MQRLDRAVRIALIGLWDRMHVAVGVDGEARSTRVGEDRARRRRRIAGSPPAPIRILRMALPVLIDVPRLVGIAAVDSGSVREGVLEAIVLVDLRRRFARRAR